MIDGEGRIGDPDEAARNEAVENHFKWVEAAAHLNCHAIRVNAHGGPGSWDEQLQIMTDAYGRIVEHGDQHDINVIIENHGGLSSDPRWLVELMQAVDHPRAGVLPDTGGFSRGDDDAEDAEIFDPFEALEMLMPYAKGVSLKGTTRMPDGSRPEADFERIMRIALDSGWRGFAGIEFGRIDGISDAHDQLEAVRETLTSEYS
jgi:sugar phosphate isomerase/epimerase